MPDFQVLELEVGDDDGTLLLEEKDTLDEEKKEESLREGNVALFFSGSEEVCLATVYTLNTIPDGLGAAARFSNTLGAGKLKAASVAVKAQHKGSCGPRQNHGYSDVFISCIGQLENCAFCWQALRAYVDLGTYYVFGIPVAAALGFLFKLRGPAPWIGLQAAMEPLFD
ncbi:hypothetical protein WN944_011654 [Citrus x changshan-huyou]|uniref:Uncharacterized protein n=1 Tax=Citrus x changshan-huyou TaxID=2935761 RepID=A0AAP0QY42_9ROSI